VAFLGEGHLRRCTHVGRVIGDLVDAAAGRLTTKEEAACRALAEPGKIAVATFAVMACGVTVLSRTAPKDLTPPKTCQVMRCRPAAQFGELSTGARAVSGWSIGE
jgi:hypothetical protein